MYKKAVRERSTEEEVDDISSRVTDLSSGQGGKHPLSEVELLQNPNVNNMGSGSSPAPAQPVAQTCVGHSNSTAGVSESSTPPQASASYPQEPYATGEEQDEPKRNETANQIV